MTDHLILSLIVGTFVGGAAAYLGSLMISKRMALVGDALGHVALPGMGLALLLKVDPGFGAFLFLLAGILLIWRLGEATTLSLETLVGIVFVSSLAVGFLIVPQLELLESLIGDIAKITASGAAASVLISTLVFFLVRKIYPGMTLLNISHELASVEGISAQRYNLIFLFSIALIVSIGVKVTGSLLVGALVIVPPATARLISAHLRQYARNSALLGAFGSIAGILLSQRLHFPAGPMIILVSTALFLLALALYKLRPLGRMLSHPTTKIP
jgi:ABC-type Mn2+/Zn2+ transport system permease subunit